MSFFEWLDEINEFYYSRGINCIIMKYKDENIYNISWFKTNDRTELESDTKFYAIVIDAIHNNRKGTKASEIKFRPEKSSHFISKPKIILRLRPITSEEKEILSLEEFKYVKPVAKTCYNVEVDLSKAIYSEYIIRARLVFFNHGKFYWVKSGGHSVQFYMNISSNINPLYKDKKKID